MRRDGRKRKRKKSFSPSKRRRGGNDRCQRQVSKRVGISERFMLHSIKGEEVLKGGNRGLPPAISLSSANLVQRLIASKEAPHLVLENSEGKEEGMEGKSVSGAWKSFVAATRGLGGRAGVRNDIQKLRIFMLWRRKNESCYQAQGDAHPKLTESCEAREAASRGTGSKKKQNRMSGPIPSGAWGEKNRRGLRR